MSDFIEYKPMDVEHNVKAAVENLRKAYWSNDTEKVAKIFTEAEGIIVSAICHGTYTVCKPDEEKPHEPKKTCFGCQGNKDFGCEDCLNKQSVDLDKEIELYKAKVDFYKSRKIREYDDTARELNFVVELLEALRSERLQGEIPVCSNCAYFGEKSVTGHCIKCRNNDLWEAKNETD